MKKRRKKVDISYVVFALMLGVIGILIAALIFNIKVQNDYNDKIRSFYNDEFKMYKSHYKNLEPEIFIEAKRSCKQHKVSISEILSLMKNESGFKKYAISKSGAMSFMQLMPATADMYKLTDPFDLRQNIDAGVRHYKMCKQKAKGNTQLAFMKYNGGPSREKFTPGGESELHGIKCMKDLMKTRELIVARI